MLKKIDYIKQYGVFQDFNWDNFTSKELSYFSKRNLIYGWNYSGKTTLSRIISSLEHQEIHSDFNHSSFRMTFENDVTVKETTLNNSPSSIRVFNTDFIEDNLKWGGSFEPIIILGKDSIKYQDQLKELNSILETSNSEIELIQESINSIHSTISTSKTNLGREIKQTLDIVGTFNTRNVQKYIDEQDTNFKDYILDKKQYSEDLVIYRNNEELDDIFFSPKVLDLNSEKILNETNELLNKTILKKIEHNLDKDPSIYKWIETGHKLNTENKKCLFCDNVITAERWDFLNQVFSSENDSLITEIDSYIIKLKSLIPEIDFFNKLQLYKELQSEYCVIKEVLLNKIDILTLNINNICSQLEKKKTKLYTPVIDENNYLFPNLSNELDQLKEIVKKHNLKNKSFQEVKNKAKARLINHFVAEYSVKIDLDSKKKEINELTNNKLVIENNINKLQFEIASIQKIISEEIRGAETINEFLNLYFGKDDIELSVNDEKKYQLMRQGHVAKNLSEGEKTAISFSYFLAKLYDKDTDIKNTILYIDDPISSLDSNHLYNTFAIIKNKLRECKQLFVSTHNYEFFKLLRDDSFFKENNKNKYKIASYYLIKRIDKDSSYLRNLPIALKEYNSEYHYLFTTLLKLREKDLFDDTYIYTLPNMIRKLLEIFTSFKIPNTKTKLDQRLIKLCKTEQDAHRIYKFINHLSHSDSITFSIEFPTQEESKEILEIVFKMIEKVDSQHFEGMNKISKRINSIIG